MRVTTAYRLLLGATLIGNVGFIEFDITGLTQDFGLINPQSLVRILTFGSIGVLAALIVLSTRNRFWDEQRGGVIYRFSFHGLWPVLFLMAQFLLSSLHLTNLVDVGLVLYRVAEWLLVVVLCAGSLPIHESGNGTSHQAFVRFSRRYTTVAVLTVVAGAVFIPSLAFSSIAGARIDRLGGYILNPNSLAILCGVGAMAFWFSASNAIDKTWAIVLVALLVLTYSRGGIGGFVISLACLAVMFGSRNSRLVLLCCALLVFLYSEVGESPGLLAITTPWVSRGADVVQLLTLNSRLDVWYAAIVATQESPIVGHGFIIGPKRLGEFVGQAWWHAPHAHNDVLNAGVGGGVLAAITTLYIYVRVAVGLATARAERNMTLLLHGIYIILVCYSLLTPVFSTQLSVQAVLMLLLIRSVALAGVARNAYASPTTEEWTDEHIADPQQISN